MKKEKKYLLIEEIINQVQIEQRQKILSFQFGVFCFLNILLTTFGFMYLARELHTDLHSITFAFIVVGWIAYAGWFIYVLAHLEEMVK